MVSSKILFDLDGIGHQLSDRRFDVPVYQRSYAWESSEIEDYIADLRNAFASSDQTYFLGTIVLAADSDSGRHRVIDGQQRLATSALMLAAIRNVFRQRDDSKRADYIHGRYLATYDDVADTDEPRLILNSEDGTFFRKRISDSDHSFAPSRDSHQLLLDAMVRLEQFVDEIAHSAGDSWPQALVAWRKFLETDVQVIQVTVPTEADAFYIFETLNSRGRDLTLADLLKNYLFGKAGDDLDAVRSAWMSAVATLDNDAELFINFVRQYWSSVYGAVRERDLYGDIKNRISSKVAATDLAHELEKAAILYAALLSPDHQHWSKMGSTVQNNVATLNRLPIAQNRPMLLAAMQHFATAELKTALRGAVSWSVRGLVVGGIGGGSTEKAYSEAAVKIRSGEIKTTGELLASITPIVPSDASFEKEFASAKVTTAKIARYYLASLERTKKGDAEPEFIPNANEEEVNLEHILPKKPDAADWPQFSEEAHRDYLHRLGNLALMQKGPNDDLGNSAYSSKRPVLKASTFGLTREASTPADWTMEAIDSRQGALAKLAVKTWHRDRVITETCGCRC